MLLCKKIKTNQNLIDILPFYRKVIGANEHDYSKTSKS